jgi:hypothetical protein
MYDRFSLGRLLADVGCVNVELLDAGMSRIVGCAAFCLDTEEGVSPHKPCSAYGEALRPGG